MAVTNQRREEERLKERKPATEKSLLESIAAMEGKLSGRMRCLVVIGITHDGKGATLLEGSDRIVVEMLAHTAKTVLEAAMEREGKKK